MLPPHYVNDKKKVVVAYIEYDHIFAYQNCFLDLFPNYSIFVVWSQSFMKEIIFLIEHDLDPFVGTNTLSDMAIAHINKYHKPVKTHFPIEIDDKIYLQLLFEDDLSTTILPFDYNLYEAFLNEFGDTFNRNGYVIFGPESNKVNAERHRFLDKNNLWPNY